MLKIPQKFGKTGLLVIAALKYTFNRTVLITLLKYIFSNIDVEMARGP
jgi:hypothetical protein